MASLLIVFSSHSVAQTRRLGLWEQWFTPNEDAKDQMAGIRKSLIESNQQFKEKMAALDTEKKKAVEAEMAASGVDLHLDKPDGVIGLQFCIDQKWLDATALSEAKNKSLCKRTVTNKPDEVTEVVLQCKQNGHKQSTKLTMIHHGDTDIVAILPTSIMRMRWIKDDCGALKK